MNLTTGSHFCHEGFYRNLFEGVPCLVAVIGKDFTVLDANRAFKKELNASPGDPCFKAFLKGDKRCPNCPVQKTFVDGGFHTTEEIGQYPDGRVGRWLVTTAPVLDDQGHIVAAIKMCQDITENTKLEEELKQSEQKYHAVFSNIPFAVFLLDPDSLNVLDVNARAKLAYGLSKAQLLKLNFMDLCAPEDAGELAAALHRVASVDRVRQLKPDGTVFYAQLSVSRYSYPGHNVLLVTAIDITSRLETEQQLIQAGKMATLGEMATGMAHEINQPLTVIQSSVDFILRKVRAGQPVPEETLTQLAELMGQHVERAAGIITHMREFGRKSELRTMPVDVGQVLQRAAEIFEQQLALRGIELSFDLQSSLPQVQADANRLEQVFINLLINARDALDSPKHEGERRILLSTRSGHGTVVVRVQDTGPGIPQALCAKIFEPFFTTKEVGKGTGLGLSISYGIIQDFGGEIAVESRPGEGASFLVRLPAASFTMDPEPKNQGD